MISTLTISIISEVVAAGCGAIAATYIAARRLHARENWHNIRSKLEFQRGYQVGVAAHEAVAAAIGPAPLPPGPVYRDAESLLDEGLMKAVRG